MKAWTTVILLSYKKNSIKYSILETVEEAPVKAVGSDRDSTVSKAKMGGLVHFESVANTVVQQVLFNTGFLVSI